MLVVSLIILIVIIVVLFSLATEDFYLDARGIYFALGIFCLIPLILIILQMQKPTAMDVYQGKTTLEITYKDGVSMDSVVIWKGGEK